MISLIVPDLPRLLGQALLTQGKKVHCFRNFQIFTFPVKHNWMQKADLALIQQSCRELVSMLGTEVSSGALIYLPEVGCGNGHRDFETEVSPILNKELKADNFTLVHYRPTW